MTNMKMLLDTKKRSIFFMVFIFLLLFISIIFNYVYFSPSLKTRDSFETTAATTSKQVIFTFYYKTNDKLCPECNKAKMEWDAFVKNNNGNSVKGYSILCNTIDCSNEQDPIVKNILKENDITELPAIRIVVDDNSIPYDAKITKSNLEKFIHHIFELLS